MNSLSKPYPEERRLATVMFADIQGFTELADRLDFEEISDLIKEVWLRLDEVIETHGGYIDKHIGDAVMAVWGAPQAQEHDAESAVRAALVLQHFLTEYTAHSPRLGASELKMRVGITTGLVLSGYVGVRGEYTVMGDTVNVASRLEHNAEPSTVVIGESTYRLVRGAFRFRRLSPMQVKGKTGLLQAFVVESELEQPSRVRYRSMGGLETHFVARDKELSLLNECYRKSRDSNTPILVLIKGEAGLGKSRLMMEFISQLEADEPALTLLSTRGLAQAQRVPFFVWKSLWHNRFSLSDNDPPETGRDKYLRGIQKLWGRQLGPVSSVEAAHLIGDLVGLEWANSPFLDVLRDDPKVRVSRAFVLTRELLRRVCSASPTVLLLDDLHWADEGSLGLLLNLLEPGSETLPMLILGAVRPGFLEQALRLARAAEVIRLGPLPVSAEIVAAAYPVLVGLPEETLAKLAQRAEGNPYFLEEMVKSLLQSKSFARGKMDRILVVESANNGLPSEGTAGKPEAYLTDELDEKLPTSLQAMLQARLDALSPQARGVALMASVVGRVFWAGATLEAARLSIGTGLLDMSHAGLEQTIMDGLAELVHNELAFPRAGSMFSGEQEYIFKHTLFREVAYGLLPHKYRRQYHLAIARWLAARSGPDYAAVVAEHLEQAGVFTEAAQQYERAADYVRSRGSARETEWLLIHARELRESELKID